MDDQNDFKGEDEQPSDAELDSENVGEECDCLGCKLRATYEANSVHSQSRVMSVVSRILSESLLAAIPAELTGDDAVLVFKVEFQLDSRDVKAAIHAAETLMGKEELERLQHQLNSGVKRD